MRPSRGEPDEPTVYAAWEVWNAEAHSWDGTTEWGFRAGFAAGWAAALAATVTE